MLIVCPACASEYEIEAALVGAEGRSVRCAGCSETWFVGPEAAEPAGAGEPDPWESAALDAEPEQEVVPPAAPVIVPTIIDQPVPPPRRARPAPRKAARRRPQGGAARLSPALAAALAFVAILPVALLGRATVVRAMPQSAGLFAAIGLPVNLRGIDLRDVVAFRNPAEGGNPAQLVVEADLVAVARGRVPVPMLEIEVRDAGDRPLHRWTAPPSRVALEPGETARFRASLAAPPPGGNHVQVRFADAASAGGTAEEASGNAEPEAREGHH